ncbi:hypothetical protein HYY69_08155 [Candidatus Woesearchaeota archaeon]|nr:hypothetical protein [Candidatus Woesearchaeota archaeon]
MRTVSKHLYIIAFVITLIIFLMGMFLGLVIDSKRVTYVQTTAKEQVVDFNSLQLQYQYLNTLGEKKDCNALLKTFDHAIKSLEDTRVRLETYDRNSQINKYEYSLLKREYTLAQLNYLFLADKASKLCDEKRSTVLYFFSDEDICPKCNEQAFVLTYLKKLFKDKLLNFAFDERLAEQEGMIAMLKTTYEIYEYPTLVVNGEVISGFSSAETLLAKICPIYKDEHLQDEIPQCNPYLNLTEEMNSTVR